MSLVFLTLFVILTSPWFFLISFEKVIPAKFYFPSIDEFLNNFFSYFSFDFLFFSGDPILKNSIPEIGVFHLWELPFLLLGFYFVFLNIKRKWTVLILLILSLTFASFFKPSPNIFISIPLLLLLSIMIAIGIDFPGREFFKRKNLIKVILFFIGLIFIFYNSFFFYHQYKIHYPKRLEKSKTFQ